MPKTTPPSLKKTPWWKSSVELGSIKDTEILLFTKHLALALKVGLTLIDGLEMLLAQSMGKMKKMIEEMIEMIKAGQPFHLALERYPKVFSSAYVNLVKTGEYTGTLEENLERMAENLRKMYELRQKVRSAMVYPMLIFIAVAGLAFSVSIFVLPKITPLFRTLNVPLPLTTRGLLAVADFFGKHGKAVALGTIVSIFGFAFLVRRNFIKPFTHRILLMLPVVKQIVKNINIVRFTRTIGILLRSGVPIDTSLQIATDSLSNRVYRKTVGSLVIEIQKGQKLAHALSYYPHLFPPLVSHMIAMGEQTGNLDKTLSYVSDFYDQEIAVTMQNLTTILEPLMLIVIGVVVGTVAISILGPIYAITGSLKG